MNFQCTRCQTTIEPASVDQNRQIATCGQCKSLVDLAPQMASGASGSAGQGARMRRPVPLPAGMTIRREPGALVITRRWLRAKHFVFLAMIAAGTAALVWAWSTMEFSVPLVLATIFLSSWDLMVLSMFVNSTTITATSSRIEVRHGPLPSLFGRGQSLAVADIRQLFAARPRGMCEVGAELKNGTRTTLVYPLVSEDQALFVEQELERRLGIVDVAVAGELGSSEPLAPEVPSPVGKGPGAAIAVVPILIGAGVVVFVLFVFGPSKVEGSLSTRGARLGDGTIALDACSSGQLQGFFGVAMTSKDAPGVVVRAMKDPVRGMLLAIERGNEQPVVLAASDCTKLDIRVNRTNTSVNDVWVVEGSATIACEEIEGSLTFSGCR